MDRSLDSWFIAGAGDEPERTIREPRTENREPRAEPCPPVGAMTGSWLRWFRGRSRPSGFASAGTLALLSLLVAFGLGVTSASAQTPEMNCNNTPASRGRGSSCDEDADSTEDIDLVVSKNLDHHRDDFGQITCPPYTLSMTVRVTSISIWAYLLKKVISLKAPSSTSGRCQVTYGIQSPCIEAPGISTITTQLRFQCHNAPGLTAEAHRHDSRLGVQFQ